MTDYTRTLPLELLHAVLDCVSHADVMTAAQVSHDWRTAARLCEEYFYIHILDPELESGFEGCATSDVSTWTSWVDASSPAPVQLFVSIPSTSHIRYPFQDVEARLRLVDTIARVIPRARQIGFLIDDDELLGEVLEAMAHIAAPLLKTVRLKADASLCYLQLPAQLFTGGAPRLHTLCLEGLVLLADHSPSLTAVRQVQLRHCRVDVGAALSGLFPILRRLHMVDCQVINFSSRAIHRVVETLQAIDALEMNEKSVDIALQTVDFSRHRFLQINGQLGAKTFIRGLPENTDIRLAMVFDDKIPIREVGGGRSSIISVLRARDVPQQVLWQHPGVGMSLAESPTTSFASVIHRLTLLDVLHWYLPDFLNLGTELPRLSTLRSHVCHRSMQNAFWPVILHGWPVACHKVQCPALRTLVLYHIRSICQIESTIRREGALPPDKWHIPASSLCKFVDVLGLLDRAADEKPTLELADLGVWQDAPDADWDAVFEDIVYKVRVPITEFRRHSSTCTAAVSVNRSSYA